MFINLVFNYLSKGFCVVFTKDSLVEKIISFSSVFKKKDEKLAVKLVESSEFIE